MSKIIFLIFLLAVLSATASAVPASPELINLNHSYGNETKAKLIGDERGYRIETANGSVISSVAAKKEFKVQDNNQQVGTGRNLAPARASFSKTTGVQKIIVILIDFPDTPPVNSNSYYQNLIFNSSAKSLNSYLKEASYSGLSIDGDVIGWYTVSQNKAFYGGDTTDVDTNQNRIDPNTWYIEGLAREAVLKADADVDFSKYDTDGDGIVDHIIIVQAGSDQASTGVQNDIWSHSSDILTYNYVKKRFTKGVIVDGVIAANYIMVSGYDPMGVIAHEFGHDLGLIDLYNTKSGESVVREWDIMDSGAWNDHGNTPSHFSAWSKWQLGWLNPTNISYPQIRTAPMIENSPTAFRIDASSTEYFLVENRQLSGYDSFLPKPGILVWHIDDSRTNNSEPVKMVALVDASNNAVPLLLAAPFAKDYGYTDFTPFTSPGSGLNNGSTSGVKIYNIGKSGVSMNLTFGYHRTIINAGFGTNYSSIQDAINASQSGDTIIIEPGNYSENILIDRELNLFSAGGANPTVFSPKDSNLPTFSISSNNVSISNFSILGINGLGTAIHAYNATNITISGNLISQNQFGMALESVNNSRLSDNEIYSNNKSGVLFIGSNNNTAEGLNNSDNENGIIVFSSKGNKFLKNLLKINRHNGLELNNSGNNIIEGNTIYNNHDSGIISLSGGNNTFTNNDIRNNNNGLNLISENFSSIYRNNFINNYLNVFDDGSNIWDGGQITGGNYYSDYTGNDTNGDGKGELPYNISPLLKDNYPFIRPFGWISRGDVNGDGQVTVVDALFIAQYTVGIRALPSSQLAAADVNGDGQVTVVDALFIAQYTVGLRQL